jgi:NDP-sugar pyrophosphorylase family protein
MPLLGQSVLEYWLAHMASSGATEVAILADDRPAYIRAIAGTGSRWGLTVSVIEESRELTPAQAHLKYDKELSLDSAQSGIIVLDHFPNLPDRLLFTDYSAHFESLFHWMTHARTPDRVGVKELMPGVYTDLRTRVSADARLISPCWLGKNVFVGAGAMVGPRTIVEDGSFIESGAMVSNSFVGSNTFVGKLAELSNSFALGGNLVNLVTGSATKVPDNFVLSALRQPRPPQSPGIFSRLSDLCSRNFAEVHLLWKNFLMKKEG